MNENDVLERRVIDSSTSYAATRGAVVEERAVIETPKRRSMTNLEGRPASPVNCNGITTTSTNNNISSNNHRDTGGKTSNTIGGHGTSRQGHTSDKGGNPVRKQARSRLRSNDSHPRLGPKARVKREATCPADIDMTKASEMSVLPPIAVHLTMSGAKSEHTASPRALLVLNPGGQGPSTSSQVASSNALSRLAMRGTASPEGHRKYSVNSHQSETALNGKSKTPPVTTPHGIPTGCVTLSNSNSHAIGRATTNLNTNVTSSSPEFSTKFHDLSRNSPLTNQLDKAKIQFEKKVLRTLAESSSSPVQQLQHSPRAAKAISPSLENPAKSQTDITHPNFKDNKSRQRRSSMKSLPKVSGPEEPFTIRQKIEQFRKWHEEQYADKLKKLNLDGDFATNIPNAKLQEMATSQAYDVDFAKILEENIVKSRTTEPSKKLGGGSGVKDVNGNVRFAKNRNGVVASNALRPTSAATWRTWRDINESDAYTDVHKYIKDNDLMDKDREAWIKRWITDVQKAMEQMGDELLLGME